MAKQTNTRKRAGRSGGPGMAGGMNFQATVTAIAAAHIARGRPLGWLKSMVDDTPTMLAAETRGPGDDLRLVLANGERVEVQAKKSLRAGTELWSALLKLAQGIRQGEIEYGVLAVGASSSEAIAAGLAEDIVRLGQGRTDGIGRHGKTLQSKLASLGIAIEPICGRLRIKLIHALRLDDADVRAARAVLEPLFGKGEHADRAWEILYEDACGLIEQRGARDATSILALFRSNRMDVMAGGACEPMRLLAQLIEWTRSTHETFAVIGAFRAIPITQGWIGLKAVRVANFGLWEGSLEEALTRYHTPAQRTRDETKSIDAETIGRFRYPAVLVAGPGMGKSTVLRRLALEYALDNFPVLRVDLKSVAAMMKDKGVGFVEAAFAIGLDGSPVNQELMRKAGLGNWVVLCDGLDETGPYQDHVAEGALKFAAAHPKARIVISTRPIGYSTALLSSWQHYELTALEASAAPAHVAGILEHLLPADKASKAADIAQRAMGSEKIRVLLARSPLMVSLAASLLARGISLGETDTKLYAAIMKMLEANPSVRRSSLPTPSSSVALRFLRLLGWFIQDRPLASLTDIHVYCSRRFEDQFDCTTLAAEEKVDHCMAYWEALGIVERIRHGASETITFVHKTFGEFAAAEQLMQLDQDQRKIAVAERVGKDNWTEVLNFAASLGGLAEITERILDGAETQEERAEAVAHALRLMVDADECPPLILRDKAFVEAVRLVGSERKILAAPVGNALAKAARKFPDEIASRMTGFTHHRQSWTRLTAWICLLHSKAPFDLADLKAALADLPKGARSARGSLSGGIVLDDAVPKLTELFLLAAVSAILTRYPGEADAIIPPALDNPWLGTIGYLIRMQSLLTAHGKSYNVESWATLEKQVYSPSSERWATSEHSFVVAVLSPLAERPGRASQSAEVGRPLVHLGAFLAFTGFWERTISDDLPLNDPEAVDAVMHAAAVVSGIPIEQLALDVKIFLSRIETEGLLTALRVVPSVDPPIEDWARLDGMANLAALERAMYLSSEFIVTLAVSSIAALVMGAALRDLVARLSENGTGLALAATAHLTHKMEASEATDLLISRLTKPLNNGSWYLFARLEELAPALDERLMRAVKLGLKAGPRTAKAAVGAVRIHAKPGAFGLQKLLIEAYSFWEKNEEPMPEKHGAIPDNPRAEILQALLAIQHPNLSTILAYCQDRRHDVSEAGREALLEMLKVCESARTQFVDKASRREVSPGVLRKVLTAGVQLTSANVAAIATLLDDGEPTYRHAAMLLLDDAYMARGEILDRAQRLTTDPEEEVREVAFRKLRAFQRA